MKRRTRVLAILALLGVFVAAGLAAYGYHAFAWMFVKPVPVARRVDLPLERIAGDGTQGFVDGTAARFYKPIRLAPFGPDAVIVADIYNHALRVVQADGQVRTLAGGPDKAGHADGPAEQARFHSPHGVAVRSDGVIAVAEAQNNTIRLLTPQNEGQANGTTRYNVSTLAGVPGQSGMRDGAAGKALFEAPHAVAWGADNELYVADIGNARIRCIKGEVVTTVAGGDETGHRDGPLAEGTLKYPMDLALEADGSLLIADAGTSRLRRWRAGEGLSTPWPQLQLAMPHGLAVAPDGTVVVAEMYGERIVSVGDNGQLTRIYGTEHKGAGPDQLYKPAAVLVHAGRLWICDLGNHRVLILAWSAVP